MSGDRTATCGTCAHRVGSRAPGSYAGCAKIPYRSFPMNAKCFGLTYREEWYEPLDKPAEASSKDNTPPPEANPNHEAFMAIASAAGRLVSQKNLAYGQSFHHSGEFLELLYPDGIQPAQYQDALALVRIFDKLMRIANAKDAFGESPAHDIIGYGILMAHYQAKRAEREAAGF